MSSAIIVKNISRTYGTGRLATQVLKGIDLQIEAGSFVAIMGKSGAGKSTLLFQLSGLDRPNTGTITIGKEIITGLRASALIHFRLMTLGYIFQDYALIPELDARENVVLPLFMRGMNWKDAYKKADLTLDNVGLSGKYAILPTQLSGGEQQRVSVARAIAGKPAVLFADEPTANLDSQSGRAIIALLKQLHHEGQTIVMVTHEEEYAQETDRIITLEDGKVIADTKVLPSQTTTTASPILTT